MSLRRIANSLSTRELQELEVLDAAKTSLAEFHKNAVDAAAVVALICEKYPETLKRSLQGKTILTLMQAAAEKYDSVSCLEPLTRALIRSPKLLDQEPVHIDWLIHLLKKPTFKESATKCLALLQLPLHIQAKIRRLTEPGVVGAIDITEKYQRYIDEANDLDNNPYVDDDILRRLPSIVGYMLPESPKQPLTEEWKRALEDVLDKEKYIEDNSSRIEACEALLSLFSVYQPNFSLNHDTSIGAWIIGCIRSRNRLLRVKAVQLLSHFINDELPPEDLAFMFAYTLKLSLKEQNQPCDSHYETVLLAWRAGSISTRFEHLNFFLLKLIGELCSSNPVKNSLALEQLQRIAHHKNETPYQLFMPFWNTVAVFLVQKPDEVLDRFSALCSITREVFLTRTARNTLPSLVLFERSNIIQNMAKVQSTSVERLLQMHIGPVIALLLTGSSSPEEFAERKLKAVSRQSLGFGIRTIVSQKKYAREILAELLKLSTTCEHSKIITAIKYVFLEKLDLDVIFNLISNYTQDLCFNKVGKLFPMGKVQYLQGLELLLNSDLANMFYIRTQVFTLLQSQMNDSLTAFYSLKAWLAMLRHLDTVSEQAESHHFYDLTIAVISYKWPDFNNNIRGQARQVLKFIAEQPNLDSLIMEYGLVKAADPEFQEAIDKIMKKNARSYPMLTQFRQIVRKCSQENFYTVYQSILDLCSFIRLHPDIIAIQLRIESETADLEEAVRILLSVSRKFDNSELRIHCADCLGLLGALDPYRISIENRTSSSALQQSTLPLEPPVVIDSFGVAEESNMFVAYVIEKYLLPELQATADPDVQMYVGFLIQEFLKFCGFGADKNQNDLRELFKQNHDSSLLSPFLYTKYKLKGSSLPTEKTYPIYSPGMLYSEWLRIFTYDAMCKATGGNAQIIFSLLRYLFAKHRDVFHFEKIARFALPYAVLNAVLFTPKTVDLIALEFTTVLNQSVDMQTSMIHQCVFSIFDYLAVWIREKRTTGGTKELAIIETLHNNISPFTLGQRALECQNYPRAIRFWEQALRADQLKPEMRDDVLNKFSQLYASLEDIDSMEGVSTQFKSWTLPQRILQYKKTEQWDAALASYTLLAQKQSGWDSSILEGTLECYRSSGRPELVLSRLSNVDSNLLTPKLIDIGVESSWRSENWQQFEKWCKLGSSSQTQSIAESLRALKNNDRQEFEVSIHKGKLLAMEDILQQEVTSLTQIRSESIFLHASCDVSSTADFMFRAASSEPSSSTFFPQLSAKSKADIQQEGAKLSRLLYNRLDRIGPAFEDHDYLLSLRRVVYKLGYDDSNEFLKKEIADTYYHGARYARKSGRYVKAIEYVLKALELEHPLARREHAKLLWSQGEEEQALRTLATELQGFDTSYERFKSPMPLNFAKNALLYTEWLDASGYATTEELVGRSAAVAKMQTRWDKVYHHRAKHWLKIYDYQLQMDSNSREISFYDGTLFRNICDPLFKTLRYGAKYVDETMPKFLTMWLDFTSEQQNEAVRAELGHLDENDCRLIMDKRKGTANAFNNLLLQTLKNKDKIPAYFFFNSLPQLLSRITTVNSEVFDIIKEIIKLVCKVYPSESIWSLVEATRSKNETRRRRGEAIFKTAMQVQPTIIHHADLVIEEFVKLCKLDLRQKDKDQGSPYTLARLNFNEKVITEHGSYVVVPTQRFLERVMPSPGVDFKKHNAFPLSAYFWSIDKNVTVMSSLQRPRKVTIRADDGHQYNLLCKGQDDVRKDARLMHFSTSINHLLASDNAAVARHLQILSYKVVPLLDNGGIIEWVDGAVPIRKLIKNMQESRGVVWNFQKIQKLLDPNFDQLKRVKNFEFILKEVKPVLYECFLHLFPDPAAWLKARNLYTQSTAVMSIVGYVLGLGDRHLENLLLVEKTGVCLHVDFDCLFDKGATFNIPEVVPFRLTQNMIDAFGVHGYEGPYRKSCEITLGVLHRNEGLLMTILEPFVHDPVILSETQRRQKITPESSLLKIQKKLKLYKMPNDVSPLTVSAPLSVQGLVEDLIKIATDPARLSRMYIGWCAFL